jgi:organic hydroperoxide reductase OsmC/OhrA
VKQHEYTATIEWTGNIGDGTADYAGYSRDFRVVIDGKQELNGSADPMFRGDATLHNPEDLFLTAISSCHLLAYLALCARRGIRVLSYQDAVTGTLELGSAGGGKFTAVTLHPSVLIADPDQVELAIQLHDTAHQYCFIANSCSVPISHQPIVTVAGAGS